MGATAAGGVVAGGGGDDEVLVRRHLLQAVEDAAVGGDDDVALRQITGGVDNLSGGADDIRQIQHGGGGFGMGQNRGFGIHPAHILQAAKLELLVDDAGGIPQHHIGACQPAQIAAEMPVGSPEYLLPLSAEVLNQFHRDA